MERPRERVRVHCRIRPGSAREQQAGLSLVGSGTSVSVSQPERSVRSWEFDSVFLPHTEQSAVFDEVGAPILRAVLDGYNGTILGYGQTGAGKTHTLLNMGDDASQVGLVPRLVAALYVAIRCDVQHVYRVRATFAQVYNEVVEDLLLKPSGARAGQRPVAARHSDGGDGLTTVECKDAEALLSVVNTGRRNLVYAETKMNKHSSRSHAVLQLRVSRRLRVLDASTGSMQASQVSGKLSVVDLAGSERVKRSGADEDTSGRRMKEAININTSLLGLSNVMNALSQNASYVPYRDSKLTHMLSDAIGGNCRTSLVVCVSPATADISESLGTLEFGTRAMKVRTNATVNHSMVTLDAAALAADLSEALQLQAEGGIGGQLLEREAQLKQLNEALLQMQAEADVEREGRRDELERAARHEAEVQEQREEIARASAEIRRLEEENSELEAAMAQQATKLLQSDRKAAELLKEVARAKEEAAAACARADEERAKGEAAAAAAAAASREHARAREEEERRRGEAAAAAAAAAAVEHADLALRILSGAVREAEAEAAAGRRAAGRTEAELQEARGEAGRARQEAAEVRARLQEAEASLKDAQLRRGEAEAAEATAAAEREAQLRGAQAEAERLKGELATAEGRLAEGAVAAEEAQAKLAEAVRRTAEVEGRAEEERLAAQAQMQTLQDAHQAITSSVEAELAPLPEQITMLQARLEEEERRAAEAVHKMCAQVDRLSGEYDGVLRALEAAEAERERLKHECEQVKGELHAELERRAQQARAQAAELTSREAQLDAALVDSRAKSTMLSSMMEEQQAAHAAVASLHHRLAEAERASLGAGRRVRRVEAELLSVRAQRKQLEAELESVGQLVKGELAEAEAERLEELRCMVAEATQREAELERQKAAGREQHERAAQEVSAAKAELRAERERSSERTEALWKRLKRQAVVQAAEVQLLRESLSNTEAERRAAMESAAVEMRQSRAALSDKDAALSGLRGSLRAANQAHLEQLLLNGAIALKHGRKGKPHARHVRCDETLRRLEWAKPDRSKAAAGNGAGLREDKGIAIADIDQILPGLATPIARRSGKGKEGVFLCVISAKRSLDLEFANEALRNTWLQTLRHWKAACTDKQGPNLSSRNNQSGGAAGDASQQSASMGLISSERGRGSESDDSDSSIDTRTSVVLS